MNKLTPKQAAIADMKAAGLDVSVLELRKTVVITEIEEYVHVLENERIVVGRRVKQTIIS